MVKFILITGVSLVFFSCGVKENVDLILINGNIITMDSANSRAEAVAVRNGKIIGVGTNEHIRGNFASMRIEDMKGNTVLPGFTDSHLHLLSLGRFLQRLNLKSTRSYQDVVDSVRNRAAITPKHRWIHGRGWDQNVWPDRTFPTNEKLNAVSENHYVVLKRVDGHAVLVNHNVLKIAGIHSKTPDPEGGKIVRDRNGNPTGVLIDNAENLILPFIPRASREEDAESLNRAFSHCHALGITSVHDAGVETDLLALYHDLGKRDQLGVQIYAMLEWTDRQLIDRYFESGPAIGLYSDFLTIRSVKMYADGALGSRGAALLAPYSDEPSTRGLIVTPPDEIYATARQALEHGFQLCTHAIGDSGNRLILNAYQSAISGSNRSADSIRWRVEHAQVVHPADFSLFGKNGVIASVQPTHSTSDMAWAESRLGAERVKGAYAWQTLIKNKARLCLGSDAPVESANPLWGIYSAVTRQDHDGKPDGGWHAGQRMSVMQAIRGYTIDAAYAAFEEKKKGSVEKGKYADLVVLSKDVTKIRPNEILKTEVRMTMVHGKIVFRK